jgi:hypothetical protein
VGNPVDTEENYIVYNTDGALKNRGHTNPNEDKGLKKYSTARSAFLKAVCGRNVKRNDTRRNWKWPTMLLTSTEETSEAIFCFDGHFVQFCISPSDKNGGCS